MFVDKFCVTRSVT